MWMSPPGDARWEQDQRFSWFLFFFPSIVLRRELRYVTSPRVHRQVSFRTDWIQDVQRRFRFGSRSYCLALEVKFLLGSSSGRLLPEITRVTILIISRFCPERSRCPPTQPAQYSSYQLHLETRAENASVSQNQRASERLAVSPNEKMFQF